MKQQDGQAHKEGWILRQSGIFKSWKRFWLVYEDEKLQYFAHQPKKGAKPSKKGTIQLDKCQSVLLAPECKKQPAFKVEVSGHHPYYFVGDTANDVQNWVSLLENSRAKIQRKNSVQVESPANSPQKNKKVTLEDFEILRVLGRGLTGKVQLVRYKKDKRLYAMKSMSKQQLSENEQVEQILSERKVLLETHHPFLVCAYFAFQTVTKIFLIIDYIPGGELFNQLKEEGKFSFQRTQLYAAEILLALGHLHSHGILYRDLKPENILLDIDGHLRITDFGLVKTNMTQGSTANTFCGTAEYMAPEIIQEIPYNKSIDWWCFGILIYEMLVGHPPFYNENTNRLYRSIVKDPVSFPRFLNNESVSFLTALLQKSPENRLGSKGDFEEIKQHEFFKGINFDDVYNKRIKPEYVPKIKNEMDTSHFEPEFTSEHPAVSLEEETLLDEETQKAFVNFTCVAEENIMNQ
ncbi:AGC family protein kinase [Histomonas meleagridis]|uniref:AGC family protein kinase n=1 Tax=Histomonas meleagridis TaxID=135588 RepID=UPI00355AA241|nr:AGC family protein kinase [Histomonas meleagridis]KAH0798354.1 AGC family protein kinase [Histomonas meleagridis]